LFETLLLLLGFSEAMMRVSFDRYCNNILSFQENGSYFLRGMGWEEWAEVISENA
jgi:hypothetical protein